ncbi:hypothetical protein B0H11DRAFT_333448 [Mycena galericulata]|nr:hypothetical protein B0H11DRAFT_333448 [Mycena galericulata]
MGAEYIHSQDNCEVRILTVYIFSVNHSQSLKHGSARRPSVGWRVHTAIVFTIETSTPLDCGKRRLSSASVSTTTQQPPYRVHSYHIPDHPEQDSSQEFQLPTPPSSSAPARTNGLPRLADSKGLGSLLGSTSSYILLAAFQHRTSLLIFRMCVFGRHKPFSRPRHKKVGGPFRGAMGPLFDDGATDFIFLGNNSVRSGRRRSCLYCAPNPFSATRLQFPISGGAVGH